jgi:hypothetical protein
LGIRLAITLPYVAADEKTPPKAPYMYSSPKAVFHAYRNALNRHEWQSSFFCMSPKARRDLVFEAFVSFGLHQHDPEFVGLLNKFGVDMKAMYAEYQKRYKKKHGTDTAKAIGDRNRAAAKAAEYGNNHATKQPASERTLATTSGAEQTPARCDHPHDEDLYREVVGDQIKDNVGFFVEVTRLLTQMEHDSPTGDLSPEILGDLEQVSVNDDVATGRAEVRHFHLEARNAEPLRKVATTSYTTYRFRRLNGGWLIESY